MRVFQTVAGNLQVAFNRFAAQVAQTHQPLIDLAFQFQFFHAPCSAFAFQTLDQRTQLGFALHG